MIKLLSYSTNRFDVLHYYLGIDYLKQFLTDNGKQVKVDNIPIHAYPTNSGDDFVIKKENDNDFSKQITDLFQLPAIIQLIKNYENGEDLLKDSKQYFTELEMENIKGLINFANNYEIKDGDIIGQQMLYLFVYHCLLFVLQLKKVNPDKKIITVFGGYHITLSKVVRKFLLKLDFVDYIVIDDGCQPLLDIANGVAESKEILGKFPKTFKYPNYSKLERIVRKESGLQVLSSIGCPNSCRFCASDREHILYDLDILKNYLISQYKLLPFHYTYYVDDLINPSLTRLKQFCNMIIELQTEYNMNFKWQSHFYPLNIDEEAVELLIKANCEAVFLGTEIFNDTVLDIINKRCNVDDYNRTIKLLNDGGITTKLGIIINLPGETKTAFLNSLENLKKIDNEYVTTIPTAFKLYPNSHIYNEPHLYGIKILNWDQDLVDSLPQIKGMVIPNTWDYIVEPELTIDERMDMLLEVIDLDDNEKKKIAEVTDNIVTLN